MQCYIVRCVLWRALGNKEGKAKQPPKPKLATMEVMVTGREHKLASVAGRDRDGGKREIGRVSHGDCADESFMREVDRTR